MRLSAPPSRSTVAAAASATAWRAAGIGEPVAKPDRQRLLVGDEFGAMRGVERRVDFGEIPDMRAMQDGGAEPDRLDRILAAMARERAAHEHDRREPVDQAEFAERVGDIDVDIRHRLRAARAQRRGQAGHFRDFRDAFAALGMARRDHRQQRRKFGAQRRCAAMMAVSSPGCVEAAAMTGRVPMISFNRRQRRFIDRRRRHVELEIAGG